MGTGCVQGIAATLVWRLGALIADPVCALCLRCTSPGAFFDGRLTQHTVITRSQIRSMRLIHLTDPHLSILDGVSWRDLTGKRWSGYLSWRKRRRHEHRPEMLERLLTAIHAEQPDLIALTGDLVHIGLAQEVEQAAAWLARLGPPERVFLVPGNHDLYGADSWSAVRAQWRAYLHLESAAEQATPFPEYPLCWRFPGVSVIGLCSSLPTPVFLATGQIGAAQLQGLSVQLRSAADRGDYRVVLIHHPPLPGQTHWRKALVDAEPLSRVLAAVGAELVLHGHLHRNGERIDGAMRVYGSASASSVVAKERASYRVFDIDPGATSTRVSMRLMQAGPAASGGFHKIAEQSWVSASAPG